MAKKVLGIFAMLAACLLIANLAAMTRHHVARHSPVAFHKIEAPSRHVRDAIAAGRYDEADKLLREELSKSTFTGGAFEPFGDFVNAVAGVGVPQFQPAFDQWAQSAKPSEFAFLVRAQYYSNLGWRTRGNGFNSTVSQDRNAAFANDLAIAQQDARRALEMNRDIPYTYLLLLEVDTSIAPAEEKKALFESAIQKYPGYYPLYTERLKELRPKWGGSVPQMIAFTSRYSSEAPENSVLRFLPLSLYTSLVEDYYVNCGGGMHGGGDVACIETEETYLKSPGMQASLKSAFDLHNHIPAYDFNQLLLSSMNCDCIAKKPLSAEFFGLAYQQLGNANYALNASYGGYLSYEDIPKAVAYFNQAIANAETFAFPTPEIGRSTKAWLNDKLAGSLLFLHQYRQMLDSANRAIALSDRSSSYYRHRCMAEFYLNLHDAALADCSTVIDIVPDDREAHYLRAKIYMLRQDISAAEADLEAVIVSHGDSKLVSQSQEREQAFDDLPMLYLREKKFDRIEALYDANPDLMRNPSPNISADYYALLCNARIQLEHYEDALAACEASLSIAPNQNAAHYKSEALKKLGRDR